MEKNKNNKKGLNKILFLGEIGPQGWQDNFVATEEQCQQIAKRFEIPGISNISAYISVIIDGEIIRVTGHLTADLKRICVATLDSLEENLDTDFEALFSENVPLLKEGEMENDIEPIERGRLDIFEIIAEQIGLNMSPFPRKIDVSGDYTEERDLGNHPFANLKNLIKKD